MVQRRPVGEVVLRSIGSTHTCEAITTSVLMPGELLGRGEQRRRWRELALRSNSTSEVMCTPANVWHHDAVAAHQRRRVGALAAVPSGIQSSITGRRDRQPVLVQPAPTELRVVGRTIGRSASRMP